MRGVETRIQEIRHAVFTEVAKMAYEEDLLIKRLRRCLIKSYLVKPVISEMTFSLKGQS